MSVLYLVFFEKKGAIRYEEALVCVPENTLVIADGTAKAYGEALRSTYCLQSELENATLAISQTINALHTKALLVEIPHFKVMILLDEHQSKRLKVGGMDARPRLGLLIYWVSIDWLACQKLAEHLAILGQAHDTLYSALLRLHANKGWSPAKYASSLGMSLKCLNTAVLNATGRPLKQWLLEQRFASVSALLTTTALPVATIGKACGFLNHAYFSAKFKLQFSCTPRAWRRLHSRPALMPHEESFNGYQRNNGLCAQV